VANSFVQLVGWSQIRNVAKDHIHKFHVLSRAKAVI